MILHPIDNLELDLTQTFIVTYRHMYQLRGATELGQSAQVAGSSDLLQGFPPLLTIGRALQQGEIKGNLTKK